MTPEDGARGAEKLRRASERLAAAAFAEWEPALVEREACLRAIGTAAPEDSADLAAALAAGERARLQLLREMETDRAALRRLKAMAPARHAGSSVACTG